MARRADPISLKLRKGVARRDRLQPGLAVPAGRPKRPRWITGEARREWDRITALLEERDMLSPVWGHGLAVYCTTWQRLQEVEQRLKEDGPMIRTAAGGLKRHPLMADYLSLQRSVRRWLAEFGLTPRSGPGAAVRPAATNQKTGRTPLGDFLA